MYTFAGQVEFRTPYRHCEKYECRFISVLTVLSTRTRLPIEMATDFEKTLKTILIVAKLCGIINIVYVLEPTGLLVPDNSMIYYSFLEILRMIVLFAITYKYFDNSFKFIKLFVLSKFWIVIIAARLSEVWIIK